MSAAAIAVGALAGVAAGLAAEPLVRRLPAGIEDALEQPAWTRTLRRPPTMEIVGAVLGAAAGWKHRPRGAAAAGAAADRVPDPDHVHRHRAPGDPGPARLPRHGGRARCPGRSSIRARLKEHILAAVIAFAVFLLMAIIYPAGMGLGDVKLALHAGRLPRQRRRARPVPRLPAVGRAVGGDPLKHGRKGGKVGIPFGPFMAAGAILGLLWGDQLIHWYMG